MPMAPTMEGDHTRTPSLECEPVGWLGEQFGELDGEARSLPTRRWLFFPFRHRQLSALADRVALAVGPAASHWRRKDAPSDIMAGTFAHRGLAECVVCVPRQCA